MNRGPVLRRARADLWRLALVIPLQGPAGLFGASCEAVGELLAHDLNAAGGVLGREVVLEIVDGGAAPSRVAAEVSRLADAGHIDAVSGWHISSVRNALAPVLAGRIPYAYSSLYEGGETRPGVYCCGETPRQQIAPALRWLRDNTGTRKWFVVGDDYVWPQQSLSAVRQFAAELGLDLVGGAFVKLGGGNMRTVVEQVARSGCESVLMLLVGQDAVQFNRAFARRGLQDSILRFSPLMDENMLLASGADATRGLVVASGYFRSLTDGNAMELVRGYTGLHGPVAPAIGAAAESCYEGGQLLAAMARHAGRLDDLNPVPHGIAYEGPRGTIEFQGIEAKQRIHLAVANGFDFDIVTCL
ncbi:substrate-binding domain-containing protein [Nocardia cyriacigeorgica]|uniref:Aliphatic amidase expression-regulating protein n=1 Tax=Nocardia cyriacigeorgica TaxID=135487 RepID=A0A4U8VWF6_9NOCA|nr:substrate-binding domain-containing protein [Nocardia cyriacigeorgica]MBF6345413.1 substrate-binding domain-containing protein [Nocardia cyriacigeorgica]VFA97841.1 Aliphatic amidase expression-regulating protein [Nocardia cyriacigeorgica]